MERIELLYKEKVDPQNTNLNEIISDLCTLLGIESINEETIADADMSDDVI